MDRDEMLGRHGRIEVFDRGTDGPDRYTILFPDADHESAGRACDLVEVVRVPRFDGQVPTAPSWGLAVAGDQFGRRVRFDGLPLTVQESVSALLGHPGSSEDQEAPGNA